MWADPNGMSTWTAVKYVGRMSDHSELVARNLRQFRTERKMSLGDLSRRCGLSKQTLSTLESGHGNPTIDTLAAVGEALGVSVRRLITEWGSTVLVHRGDDQEVDVRHGIGTIDLDRIWGSGEVRTALLAWEHAPRRPKPVPAHGFGTLHHIYVLEGDVRCGPEAQPVELGAGDFIQCPADVPHWMSPLASGCRLHVVTTIPRATQFRP